MAGTSLDCCIYYGILIDKNDLHNIATLNGSKDIPSFISKYSYDYRFVGPISYSRKVIVGKELHWDYGSYATELDFENQKLSLKSVLSLENGKFTIDNSFSFGDNHEFVELENSFKLAGFNSKPKFYIITSKE